MHLEDGEKGITISLVKPKIERRQILKEGRKDQIEKKTSKMTDGRKRI